MTTSFDDLPVAYRSWIMLDRGGRAVDLQNLEGFYVVHMRGRFKGRQTILRVPFSRDDMAKATKAAGVIHVFDRIAEAMVKRYNTNTAALNKLSPKELRKIEQAPDSRVLDFSHPRSDPG